MSIKARLKKYRKKLTSFIDRNLYSFSCHDLKNRLIGCDIKPGDCLLVHSSLNRFGGFSGEPVDILQMLESLVGVSGCVAMPTIPFSGSSEDYVKTKPIFDVIRTPSRVGLLTELFRRQRHVIRSLHPTHPIAACGPLSKELIDGHSMAPHPCGEHSPWSKLERYNTKIVFLGAPFASMTYVHAFDDLPGLPSLLPVFTPEKYVMECRDHQGKKIEIETMITSKALGKVRDLSILHDALETAGDLCKSKLGKLEIIVVSTVSVGRAVRNLASNGMSHYNPKGLKPSQLSIT
jgi:aminoglycoside 3-N-acetyltransferase